MKPFLCTLSMLLATFALPVLAQSDSNPAVTGDPLWHIQINPQRLFSSNFGTILRDLVAAEHPDAQEKMDGFSKALGLDPRTDVKEILIYGDNFDDDAATVIAQLGASSGNLAGWFLAAPGYQSEDLDSNTVLHSFLVEDKKNKPRLWCTLPHSQANNSYALIASFDRDQTINLTKKIAEQGNAGLNSANSGNTILSLAIRDVSQVPMKHDSNDPGAAIAKSIRSMKAQVTAEADSLTANSTLTADSPARAQQLQQLINGLKAMVQLAAMHEESPRADRQNSEKKGRQHHRHDAKKLAELLNHLTINYEAGSSTLTTNFTMSYDELKAIKMDK